MALEKLPIKSLIEDTLTNVVIFPSTLSQCVSVEETAIEKWVGLTRRIIAIERGYHADDSTLIRHVYDLNAIVQANKINADFFALVKDIVSNDAKQFKNQHHEYSIDPATEIEQSLTLLKTKQLWQNRYQEFIETMVYDNVAALAYNKAIATLELLSNRVLVDLHR